MRASDGMIQPSLISSGITLVQDGKELETVRNEEIVAN
jgi:hypothetical protein